MMLTGSHRGAAVAAAALLAAVAVTGVAAAAAAAPQTRKNVLFFAVDDLRTQLNYMGGHPEGAIGPTMHTPHIDSLASESLRCVQSPHERRTAQLVPSHCVLSPTQLANTQEPHFTRAIPAVCPIRLLVHNRLRRAAVQQAVCSPTRR